MDGFGVEFGRPGRASATLMKPCGTWVVTDIPADEAGSVMAAYRAQDPLLVVRQEQFDRRWTVTAVFPDCPPGQLNIRERRHSEG
jgi:hypothetical protein